MSPLESCSRTVPRPRGAPPSAPSYPWCRSGTWSSVSAHGPVRRPGVVLTRLDPSSYRTRLGRYGRSTTPRLSSPDLGGTPTHLFLHEGSSFCGFRESCSLRTQGDGGETYVGTSGAKTSARLHDYGFSGSPRPLTRFGKGTQRGRLGRLVFFTCRDERNLIPTSQSQCR